MSREHIIVTGNDCLDYINRPIGFSSHNNIDAGTSEIFRGYTKGILRGTTHYKLQTNGFQFFTLLYRWYHNPNRRIVGYVKERSDDGGFHIYILGNETLRNYGGSDVEGGIDYIQTTIGVNSKYEYTYHPIDHNYTLDGPLTSIPYYNTVSNPYVQCQYMGDNATATDISFDEVIDYKPEFHKNSSTKVLGAPFKYHGAEVPNTILHITDDIENTLEFGCLYDMSGDDGNGIRWAYPETFIGDSISFLAGNLYNFSVTEFVEANGAAPPVILEDEVSSLGAWSYLWRGCGGFTTLANTSLTAFAYNLILTDNLDYAKNYLNTGELPPDAFLYPLDFDNLPTYDDPIPTGDSPEDYPDDNTPDDDTRDFDKTPVETPTFTINQLTNYNWYWLDVTQWADFIRWFWNDIGNYNDFDDLIAKVKGLYNDVASAVIMCRYYPVEYEWITGVPFSQAPTDVIKLGMIEKTGTVSVIDQTRPLRVRDIGHVHIGDKYNSFMDMSPYSQLSLYLPWHGFIDLDINLFSGHDLYVKALYDYLSGTIQYYIYYDNEVVVNTVLAKMAMDIPITLQTKNDRDSTIFSNVSSTIGGLVGAGVGIASGNPIGMVMGVTQGIGALNKGNASAPMRLMGNVGESGGYLGFQKCFVVIRRPTIQPSDGNSQTSIAKGLKTWKHNVGMLCGYGYNLSDLKGKGFTMCHTPRIDFKNTAPLQTEVDEIYSYLEKGVIL